MIDKYIKPENRKRFNSESEIFHLKNFYYGIKYSQQNGSADLRFKNFGVIHKDVLNDPRYKYKKDDENLMIPLHLNRFARPSTYEQLLYAREKNFFINRYQKLFYIFSKYRYRFDFFSIFVLYLYLIYFIHLEGVINDTLILSFLLLTLSIIHFFDTMFKYFLKKDIKEVEKLGWDKRLDLYYGWKNPWRLNDLHFDIFTPYDNRLIDKEFIKKPYTKEEIEICKYNEKAEIKEYTMGKHSWYSLFIFTKPVLFLIIAYILFMIS